MGVSSSPWLTPLAPLAVEESASAETAAAALVDGSGGAVPAVAGEGCGGAGVGGEVWEEGRGECVGVGE